MRKVEEAFLFGVAGHLMPKMAHGVLVGLVVCLVATIAIAADEQLDDLGFAPRAELRLMARPAGGHNEPVEVVGQWVVYPSQEWQIRVTATQDSFAYIVGYSHGDAATLIWPAQDDLSLGRLLADVNRSFPADGSFLQASGFQAYQRVLVLLSATQLSEISSTLVRIEAQGGKDQQVRLAVRPQSIEVVSSHVLIPLDTESEYRRPIAAMYSTNREPDFTHSSLVTLSRLMPRWLLHKKIRSKSQWRSVPRVKRPP